MKTKTNYIFAILFLCLFTLGHACKKKTPQEAARVYNSTDNHIPYKTPEELIDSLFYFIQHNKYNQINSCFLVDIEGNEFINYKVKKYIIAEKEIIGDNETNYENKGEIRLKVKILDQFNDTFIVNYIIRKINNSWIITGYSTIYEDQMEYDIQRTIEDLPTSIDSLEIYRMKKFDN